MRVPGCVGAASRGYSCVGCRYRIGVPQYRHSMVFGTMWLHFLHRVRASCISSVSTVGSGMIMYSWAIFLRLLFLEIGFKVAAVFGGEEMGECGLCVGINILNPSTCHD